MGRKSLLLEGCDPRLIEVLHLFECLTAWPLQDVTTFGTFLKIGLHFMDPNQVNPLTTISLSHSLSLSISLSPNIGVLFFENDINTSYDDVIMAAKRNSQLLSIAAISLSLSVDKMYLRKGTRPLFTKTLSPLNIFLAKM